MFRPRLCPGGTVLEHRSGPFTKSLVQFHETSCKIAGTPPEAVAAQRTPAS